MKKVLITMGLVYRFAIITFFLTRSYVFLLEQTQHLNHFHLVAQSLVLPDAYRSVIFFSGVA